MLNHVEFDNLQKLRRLFLMWVPLDSCWSLTKTRVARNKKRE